MKKATALLMALLLCSLTLLISCGDSRADTTTTTTSAASDATGSQTDAPVVEQPKSPFDELKKENLGGYVFNILYPVADNCFNDFLAETQTGDIQNDAVFARNLAVKEALNIDIKLDYCAINDVNTKAKQQFMAGDNSYDMFGGHRNSLPLAYEGYLYDLAQVSTLSLDEEWWDQGYKEAMTMNDSLYTIIGDMSISSLLFVSSLCFNKALFDTHKMEYPYQAVKDGKWTYEALNQLVVGSAVDLNNDGKITSDADLLGITGWAYESSYSMFYSSGFTFVNRDANGAYEMNYNQEKLTDITEKTVGLWISDDAHMAQGTAADHEDLYAIFPQGRSFFADICLSKIGTFFTGMKDDYGIVPLPKYDESQDRYYSYAGYTIPIAFMTANNPDPERTGLIMEAFSRASYVMVTPDMLEVVTKLKNVRDDDSAQMIDLILRNKIFDAAHFFKISGFCDLPFNMISSGATNVTTRIKSIAKPAKNQLEKIQASFDKLKTN